MADGNSAFAAQIDKYLKRNKRKHRVLLSLSEQEIVMLNNAATQAGCPVSSFARAACMLGTTIYLKGSDDA